MAEVPATSVEQLPQAVVVHVLATELRKTQVDALCDGIDKARAAAPTLPFIVDMANVGFVGSLAMGVLAGLNQEFRRRSQRLMFVSLQAEVYKAIHVTRVDRILEIMDDVGAAVKSLEPHG